MDITIFNHVLDIINNILVTIVGIAFGFQIIYILLFFLPARKYPESEVKHKCGVIICAKDEEVVIGRTIKIIQESNYPKDKFEIIVMADNCSDKTAEIARSLSSEVKVTVFERTETDKKKCNVGNALKSLFNQIGDNVHNYDFFIRFDADDIVDANYISKMNDAFSTGIQAAKGYNHSTNLTQNVIAGVSGLWYIRDSRFNCQARNAIHTDTHMVGGGMMFSAKTIIDEGGWVCLQSSEDTEFTILCETRNNFVGYVSDAIVYEDQPSTLRDIFRRNVRMGHALHHLFWTKGWYCLFKFFTTFKYKWIDMFLNLFFIPIAVLCCTWLPFYYIYSYVWNLCNPTVNPGMAQTILNGILIALSCAFVIPFILQAFLVYFLDKKKINQPLKKMLPTILLFPLFMIIYAASIFIGVFSRPKWKKAKRNVDYVDDIQK